MTASVERRLFLRSVQRSGNLSGKGLESAGRRTGLEIGNCRLEYLLGSNNLIVAGSSYSN